MALFIIVSGLILAILSFIYVSAKNNYNIFLSLFFFFVSLNYLVVYSTIIRPSIELLRLTFPILLPAQWVLGPVLYFYSRGLTGKVNNRIWPHFIPAFLVLLNSLYFYLTPINEQQQIIQAIFINPSNLFHFPTLIDIEKMLPLRILHPACYFILSFLTIFKSRSQLANSSFRKNPHLLWGLLLTSASAFHAILIPLVWKGLTNLVTSDIALMEINYIINISSFVTGLANTTILFFPNILFGMQEENIEMLRYKPWIDPLMEKSLKRDFKLPEEKLLEIDQLLNEYKKQKPYLQTSFSKPQLINDLQIPAHHLTYYFNEYRKMTFSTWKSNLQIEESLHLIKSGYLEKHTIESLANEVGFNSRTKFSDAFKKTTGVSPRDYLQQQ